MYSVVKKLVFVKISVYEHCACDSIIRKHVQLRMLTSSLTANKTPESDCVSKRLTAPATDNELMH